MSCCQALTELDTILPLEGNADTARPSVCLRLLIAVVCKEAQLVRCLGYETGRIG
jgi:hypothetical protein